ncbi:B3/B4 domain-containing protein [Cronobacter turicensis]|uniref:B3/B4 domain-containing protein n=1 Tax=Cronobacter turicensis TaxID=413502 RepID=UPI000CFBB2D0|nr:B3/4 domain-containing protein [Cronobacter turicensis]EKY1943478.1 B3/4 domain-containing protein [Cronobacter turicensis]EKY1993017.1 B3/4 domain-containing protein [Cronobacter turicensis]ELY4608459.1 B3/4 domain-containing protein [Cronobacter turicensis]
MKPLRPSIAPEIAQLAPGFRAISINVIAAPLADETVGRRALEVACRHVQENDFAWAQAHLAAWDAVFQAFGAKPKRTPCSAQALRKRVARDGTMASLDPVVDLYNAVSIKYAVPIGGENRAAYQGEPRLVIACGSEVFDTFKDGEPVNESPDPGEPVWRDDAGVTCRRWNWRQGVRTRLDSQAQAMWFILECLPEMPVEAAEAAARELADGLTAMMPGAEITTETIQPT